jgi:predicted GNAT family acetyltransferase
MSEQTNDIEVVDNPDAQRFEARIDGKLVGLADYRIRDGRAVFPHTEVDPDVGGKGVGTKLVREALDRMIATGNTVVPQCPFVAEVIRRYPDEYQEHVAA